MNHITSTVELFLIAMLIVFSVPYLIWRGLRTEYYAPLVVVQIIAGILRRVEKNWACANFVIMADSLSSISPGRGPSGKHGSARCRARYTCAFRRCP